MRYIAGILAFVTVFTLYYSLTLSYTVDRHGEMVQRAIAKDIQTIKRGEGWNKWEWTIARLNGYKYSAKGEW